MLHAQHIRAAVLTASITALTGLARGQSYQILDLGTLGGPTSAAFGVNGAGQAVGVSTTESLAFNGVYAVGGVAQAIAPLGEDPLCWAMGINASGLVIGQSFSHHVQTTHGFAWQNGVTQDLGNFAPRAVNGAGVIAGCVTVSDPALGPLDHAAVWSGGAATDLGTFGGLTSTAAGINSGGWVVGWASNASDVMRAVLWINGAASDLGTLGGASAQAYAVSDGRMVAGVSDTVSGQPHAFRYTLDGAGAVTARQDLGVLGGTASCAYAINTAGDVVGTSGSHAFLWRSGQIVDLNSLLPAGSGWVLERAWAISDAGHIAGAGRHNGWPRAFVLQRSCYANCDASTTPPVLNILDFGCFLNKFAAGDAGANCDGSTTPPVLNVLDFTCFLNAFAIGCG